MNAPTAQDVEQELAAYLKQTAAERRRPLLSLGPDDHFFESGILDSLSLVDFVAFLEHRYGIEIPGADISPENMGSLRIVVEYVQRRLAALRQ